MTDNATVPRELLRQVFYYLNCGKDGLWDSDSVGGRKLLDELRSALDAPAVEPVAWRWAYKGQPDSDKCFPMPVPDQDVQDVAKMRAFPRTVQLLYAAPQAQQPANEFRPDWDQVNPFLDRIAELEAQQPRKAVKLSDEELRDALRSCPTDAIEPLRTRWLYAKDFARAIEQAVLKANGVEE